MQGLFGITVLLLLLLPDPIRNLDAGKVLKTKWRKKCLLTLSPEDEIEEP
jgi:hypothetical protein